MPPKRVIKTLSIQDKFNLIKDVDSGFKKKDIAVNLTTGTPSVIIIGAGPAGIAAASKLFENSITNITVLEAENRVGGRINSVKFGDKFVDLGAEYCHGKKNNIVYELVKDLNVLEPISDVFEPRVYYSNGSRLDPVFIEELQAVILGYDSHISHFNETGSSIGELFVKKYNATIIQKYSGDSKKIKILNEALRLAEKVSLMIDGAFSWLDTSTVKHYERSEGHQLLVWKGRGYRTVLEVLTGAFPDPERKLPIEDKILLNKQVSKIVWNGDSQVVVHTSDNSSYNADHVIFTPSVGVLKELKDSLFTPFLPSSKQDAIEAIGIAGVMKIMMHFETEWWKDDDVIFSFIWREEDLLNTAAEFSAGPVKNGVSWVSAITVMAKVPGNPNILIAWVTGDMVPDIEQTSLTTWRSNHHFRGTYSYERAGFENPTVRHQSVLSDPLTDVSGKPVVLFAGEASNPVHYSTVHGAIETGRREALRLIDLYKH
ncbi:hypothetical protein GEV33_009516 [Tenebrio molitor]|uniref:Amine oxidase domain-containing protein n=1 Tax=Tenebrio molitor TaxID=7067 RepID=A0A8J6LH80_TENMO|nr:hypothetical protein GEV33_009516 [Tenebrio molitor]